MAIINGSNGNDPLQGSSLADTINGFAGNDTVLGLAGNDLIDGGADNDFLDGGADNDTLLGGTGDDGLSGAAGDDSINGGEGFDYAYYDLAVSAVNVSLITNTASGGDGNDTLVSIEGVYGSAYNDTLTGNDSDNDLIGFSGNDSLVGGGGFDYLIGDDPTTSVGGNDTLLGGDGGDTLWGGAGNDILDGGSGVDVAIYNKQFSNYTITQQGNNVIVTNAADGVDTLSGVEHLTFSDAFYITTAQGTGLAATQIVSTVFGAAAVSETALLGQYLALLEGGYTFEETIAAALSSDRFATGAGSHSNSDVVNYVFKNVAGFLPDAATHDSLVQLLTSGTYTQASLVAAATVYTGAPNFLLKVTPQTLSIVVGTEGADASLAGTVDNDYMLGHGGNDVFFSGAGSDLINGGAGVDRSVYASTKSAYTVTVSDLGLSVKTNANTDKDVLTSVERLTFSDISVAYDLTGNAGTAAKIVGAMFGAATLQNEAVVGQYLAMLDAGMSYEAVTSAAAASALFASQAGGHSNAQYVDHVFFNVAGIHPGQQDLQTFVNMLETQGYTQGSLGVLAADTIYNLANVNLTGLAQTGLEYTLS